MKTIEEYLNVDDGRNYSFVDHDDLRAWQEELRARQEELDQLRAAWRKVVGASAVPHFCVPAEGQRTC